MTDLPDDALRNIFRYLSDARDMCFVTEVCKTWSRVALSNGELWSRLSLSEPKQQYCAYPKRRKREIDYREGVSLAIRVLNQRSCRQLREIDLVNVRQGKFAAKNSDLQAILRDCRNTLEVLKLNGEHFIVRAKTLGHVVSACTQLRVLHVLSFSTALNQSNFNAICSKCPNLEDIDIFNCPNMFCTHAGLASALHPVRKTLRALRVSQTNIASLPLALFGTEYPSLEEIYADECVRLIQKDPNGDFLADGAEMTLFPSLKVFSVNNSQHFATQWSDLIVKYAKKLEYFSLDCMHGQFISTFRVQPDPRLSADILWDRVTRLKTLSLMGQRIGDTYWKTILCCLSSTLEFCDLGRNTPLTGALAPETIQDKKFARLHTLLVSQTSFTDDSVRQVLELAPKLKQLDLSGCRSVRDRKLRRDPLGLL